MGLSEADLFACDENAELSPVPSTERPYLSDYISFANDIKPYPFVLLWSGIGSGKNTFVEHLVNGCPQKDIPKLIVLLITSRKSKVLETLDADDLDISNRLSNAGNEYDILLNTSHHPDYYSRYIKQNGKKHKIIQRSIACTNATIEKYHQYCFDPNDPSTHLWNRFDIIVWDEVHSLMMDSTFQSAPFHVMRLLQTTYKLLTKEPNLTRCKKIIAMTGTPECLDETYFPQLAHLIDVRKQCRTVVPKNIYFLDSIQAQRRIRQQLQVGERILYFSNHVEYPDKLADTYGISKARIAVSFSDQDRREKFKKECAKATAEENDYERMVAVEAYLTSASLLHQDISLFFTTSKNKEGININNDDIHHVYIESHSINDIQQMAGRIRNGAEHVYIITDSRGHSSGELYCEDVLNEYLCTDYKFSENKLEPCYPLDRNLERFCRKNGIYNLVGNANAKVRAYSEAHPKIGKFIDTTLKKLVYIQFDFFSNRFHFNHYRRAARKWMEQERMQFDQGLEKPAELVAYFQKAFPESTVHFPKTRLQQGQEHLQAFLQAHPENRFSLDTVNALANEIYQLISDTPLSSSDKLPDKNRVLGKIDYRAERFNKNAAHANYHFFRIVPRPTKQAAA